MNRLTQEIDAAVLRAVARVSGFVTNEQLRDAIGDDWPLPRFDPTPTRIGRAMARLGFKPWRLRETRGWEIESSNIPICLKKAPEAGKKEGG